MSHKLDYIDDNVAWNNYNVDLDDQSANNYVYDQSGNLVSDAQARINNIKWSADGKVLEVQKGGSQEPDTLINFIYDATGSRVIKQYTIEGPTGPSSSYTFYLRDANTEPIAIYESHTYASWQEYAVLNEWNIYGSEAQGRFARKLGYDVNSPDTITYSFEGFWYPPDSSFERRLQYKEYEHKDHLGNVRLVYSDLKTAPGFPYQPLNFELDLRAVDNYYPFGMLMPERRWQSGGYRYGFNGKEMDNEVKGEGNSYDYGARFYDPRLGRWLTADPKSGKYPGWSPYHFGYCSPIITIDPDGEENVVVIGGADIGQQDRYKFINSGLGQAFRYGGTEKTTIVLITANMKNEEIEKVKQSVAAGNVNLYEGRQIVDIITVSSADEVANYINSKSPKRKDVSLKRLDDKVTDAAIFGHGIAGSMEFGYDYIDGPKSPEEKLLSFGKEQIDKLDPNAFDDAEIDIYTCNSATEKDGVNVAKDISKQTNSTVTGYEGSSSYKGIYGLWDRFLKKMGYDMLPSSNKPSEGEGAKEKEYNNGEEQ